MLARARQATDTAAAAASFSSRAKEEEEPEEEEVAVEEVYVMTDEEIIEEYACCGCYAWCLCGCCCCCGPFRRCVNTQTFDYFVLGCIMLNTIVMALEYHGQPQAWSDMIMVINWCPPISPT